MQGASFFRVANVSQGQQLTRLSAEERRRFFYRAIAFDVLRVSKETFGFRLTRDAASTALATVPRQVPSRPVVLRVRPDMGSHGSRKESRHSRMLMPVFLSTCAIPISMLFWIVNVAYSILWPDAADSTEGFVLRDKRFQMRSRVIALEVRPENMRV